MVKVTTFRAVCSCNIINYDTVVLPVRRSLRSYCSICLPHDAEMLGARGETPADCQNDPEGTVAGSYPCSLPVSHPGRGFDDTDAALFPSLMSPCGSTPYRGKEDSQTKKKKKKVLNVRPGPSGRPKDSTLRSGVVPEPPKLEVLGDQKSMSMTAGR